MKTLLLFGAGKSATVLIDYLKKISLEEVWNVIIADADAKAVQAKIGEHPLVKPVALDINDTSKRQELIQKADIVISLMPPALHFIIAEDCVAFSKNLLTASYVDEKIESLRSKIEDKGLLFLCEMGLDPGIDHMSAMKIIDAIKAQGGTITSFKSHCGGLVAEESDDNPWHYKISWNPRNVVMAGKAGAIYKQQNEIINKEYNNIFTLENNLPIEENIWSFYPNRDSLSYIKTYGLESAETFIRTTIRHPEFMFGWKNIVELKLTDEEKVYETDGMKISDFFKIHFDKHGFSEWFSEMLMSRLSFAKEMMENLMNLIEAEEDEEGTQKADDDNTELMMINEKGELDTVDVEELKNKSAETVAEKMHEANVTMKQLFYLGLDDDTTINKGLCSAADVLQFVLEKKLVLEPTDKDRVIMLHEIEYELNGETKKIESLLDLNGDDAVHTAMAKTVGLPLGIAARLILNGKIETKGLYIPIIKEIYNPVLDELEKNGIVFKEKGF